MRHSYSIKIGSWRSKEEYTYYEANRIRKNLKGCFIQRVMAVRVR